VRDEKARVRRDREEEPREENGVERQRKELEIFQDLQPVHKTSVWTDKYKRDIASTDVLLKLVPSCPTITALYVGSYPTYPKSRHQLMSAALRQGQNVQCGIPFPSPPAATG
jgi:hypothetical protein